MQLKQFQAHRDFISGGPLVTSKHLGRKYRTQERTIHKRASLKTSTFDSQVSQSKTANIVTLEFDQFTTYARINSQIPRTSRKVSLWIDKKPTTNYKQISHKKYQSLARDLGKFLKSTLQVQKHKAMGAIDDVVDNFAQRKLINIQKISVPSRDSRRQLFGRYRQKTAISHKTLVRDKEENSQKQLFSVSRENSSIREVHIKSQTADLQICRKSLQHAAYNFQIQTPQPQPQIQIAKVRAKPDIMVRRPANRKDYFVFGMSDRINQSQNKIQSYRDLLWKVNYSNGLYVQTPNQISNSYRCYVGPGNNSNLIKGILSRRQWWSITSNKNQENVSFMWTQLKNNAFFTQQTIKNPPNNELCYEQALEELTQIADKDKDPHRKIFNNYDYSSWQSHLAKNEKTQKKISQNTYQKRLKLYQKKEIRKINDSRQLRLHNHMEFNFYIGNKKALFYNIKRYLQCKKESSQSIIPLTFHISKGTEDPQYQEFLKHYNSFEQSKKNQKNIKNIWIVKPGQNTNRGNGITVCHCLDDIIVRLKGRERNSDGKFRTFIIQKYIQRPLLYNKRKFDIRHYVLISCINGCIKAYWYEQGYVRTSSSEFHLKAGKDQYVHLTNDAVQKFSADYGKYEKGNKLSYADLQKYLDSSQKRKISFFDEILPRMKHFATQAIKATFAFLDPNRRSHNFQLLGLDFMIDEDFQPYLIQANTNPCLQLSSPLLRRIIPSVIQNMFKICVDPLFPPPQVWPNNKKFSFGEDSISDNKFELIFDESVEGNDLRKRLQDLSKGDQGMNCIEQDDETFDNQGQQWQKIQ